METEKMTSQDGHALYGVGGWLAWWIFISTFISPILGFGQYATLYASSKIKSAGDVPLFVHVIGISTVAVSIWQLVVALNLIYRLIPASRTMAITFHFASPIFTWLVCELVFTAYNLDRSIFFEEFGKGVFISLIWGTYFIRSKRCKNTYGLSEF